MMMRAVLAFAIYAFALFAPAQAQIALPFPGPGAASTAAAYVGPGDVFSTSVTVAYSCSEAYNAAGANTSTSACDLVDSAAPTTVICTLRFTSTGKVDLTAYCPGSVTPAAKCAAATGGVCNISKAYNLANTGTLDAVQTAAASQPTLAFSSTPLGTLPAINCGPGGGTALFLSPTGTITQSQPFTISGVYMRNSGTGEGMFLGGPLGSNFGGIGAGGGANLAEVDGGNKPTVAATDSAWHALIGFINGASTAANVDGTDTSPLSGGIVNLSAVNIRVCRANGFSLGGLLAEAQWYNTSSTSTNRNAISANAHSAGRYNF
jgi:hypothetical protein